MNKSGLKIVEFMIHDKQYLESFNKSRDLIFFKRKKKSKYWRKVGNEETGDKISDFAPQHWSTKRCPGVSRNICVGGAAGLE